MANVPGGGPVRRIPAGARIVVLPFDQDPVIVSKMKESGLTGEFYLVGLFDTVLSVNPQLHVVVAEELERRVEESVSEVPTVSRTAPSSPSRVFHPVEIAGEPLSATVIRERG